MGSRSRLEVARASLNRAQTDRDHAQVLSPIDGIVLVRTAEEGSAFAATLQTPVWCQIAEDLARMELRVDVDEADVGRVLEQQHATFTVDSYSDRTFDAHITRLDFASHIVERVFAYEAVLAVENRD